MQYICYASHIVTKRNLQQFYVAICASKLNTQLQLQSLIRGGGGGGRGGGGGGGGGAILVCAPPAIK